MTSAEEVLHTPCSISARQTEPPGPKEELVLVFFAPTCNFDWLYFGPQACKGAHIWRARSMTSTEEIQLNPSSISACE